MKRFKFRLEAVETIRKHKEQDALQVLGRARRELQLILARKSQLESTLADALLRRESLADSPSNSHEFAIIEQFITGTRLRVRQAEQHASRALRVVERATRGYMHARRDCLVIDTIRESDLQEFRKERARAEMREMDDLSSIRAARERGEA
jgi:flagellar FliJ protein